MPPSPKVSTTAAAASSSVAPPSFYIKRMLMRHIVTQRASSRSRRSRRRKAHSEYIGRPTAGSETSAYAKLYSRCHPNVAPNGSRHTLMLGTSLSLIEALLQVYRRLFVSILTLSSQLRWQHYELAKPPLLRSNCSASMDVLTTASPRTRIVILLA